MVLGARLEAEGLAKFFFSIRQLLCIHQRGAEIVVGQAGIGIERNGFTQHVHGFLIFSREQERLPQNAMFGRSGGIGSDGGL